MYISLVFTLFLNNFKLSEFRNSPRIIGGEDTDKFDFPHQAQLVKDNELVCGASILNETTLLTAAHCFLDPKEEVIKSSISLGRLDLWTVYANSYRADKTWRESYKDEVQQRQISKIVIHPCYNGTRANENGKIDRSHDLAILTLDKELDLSGFMITKINLPRKNEILPTEGMIIGWGHVGSVGSPGGVKLADILQKAQIPLLKNEDCQKEYLSNEFYENETISDFMICAGVWKGQGERKDTCKGDSGSPLLVISSVCKSNQKHADLYLAGITSFGSKVCAKFVPGVYVLLSKYICWILYLEWPPNCPLTPPICPHEKWKDAKCLNFTDHNDIKKTGRSNGSKISLNSILLLYNMLSKVTYRLLIKSSDWI